jgi:hypothetical protein
LGFGVQGVGFRVWGLGFGVEGLLPASPPGDLDSIETPLRLKESKVICGFGPEIAHTHRALFAYSGDALEVIVEESRPTCLRV